jgi:hypothetical protein
MSIATLKRKTQTQYNNMSVGQPTFSLNGTRRSPGYVGQDTLGRSLVRSLSRNGALKGHGGCCGAYPVNQIKNSPEMAHLNNASVVKSSSLTNSGLISTKYRWTRRPQPITTWKPDHSNNINTQAFYIDKVALKAILDGSCHKVDEKMTGNCAPCNKGWNYNYPPKPKPISKSASHTGALDASDRIRAINSKCVMQDLFYYIPRNTKNLPVGCQNLK